jgi:hypothetical protein
VGKERARVLHLLHFSPNLSSHPSMLVRGARPIRLFRPVNFLVACLSVIAPSPSLPANFVRPRSAPLSPQSVSCASQIAKLSAPIIDFASIVLSKTCLFIDHSDLSPVSCSFSYPTKLPRWLLWRHRLACFDSYSSVPVLAIPHGHWLHALSPENAVLPSDHFPPITSDPCTCQ